MRACARATFREAAGDALALDMIRLLTDSRPSLLRSTSGMGMPGRHRRGGGRRVQGPQKVLSGARRRGKCPVTTLQLTTFSKGATMGRAAPKN